MKWLLPVVVSLLSFGASAQIVISNGVQKYASLTNTTVTMSGKCEVWVTNPSAPLSGCTIHLNSTDAYLVLPRIKPSTTVSTYLGQVKINGSAAVADSNCRVVEYAMGSIVLPHGSSFQALQVYSGPYYTGVSSNLSQYYYYNTAGRLGAFYANIGSFKLKRGYAATLARNANGSGISRNYVAADGDMEVSVLPSELEGNVQFVYVVPWRWTSKKGVAGAIASGLNLGWYYNWNIDQNSSRDLEYVPIRQSRWWPGLGQNWKSRGTSQLLGYNEPDRPDQANMSVSAAISSWPDLLATGLRVGAPAVSDGGRSSWLYPFMQQANSANLRVDFVPIHRYVCHNPSDPAGAASSMYDALKSVYDQVKRPLWITEWNNGANWTGCGDPTFAQQKQAVAAIIDMLDNTPFVERYAIYNWVEDCRRVKWDDGSLTSAGVSYRDKQSPVGYVQALADNGKRGIAQLLFETNTLDTSGLGNSGIMAGSPAFTTGRRGQGIVFDGANTVVTLPPNIAKAGSFTFAAWIKWDGGANWQRIFDFGNSTTEYMYLTPRSGDGTLQFGIKNGGGTERVETGAIPAGSWQHVAITLGGGTASLYVNGALAAQNTGMSITPSSFAPIVNRLGKSQWTSDPLFSGMMDEVLIKDYALSATQIARLQTNTPPQFTNSAIVLAGGSEGAAYAGTLAGAATDADPGDTLSFSKQSGPAWLSIAGNGTLSGKPTAGDGGMNYFTVAVSDGAAQNAYAVVMIPVMVLTANGTWISDADGNWSETNRWTGGQVASGINQAADFSTINITADRTVTLDSSRSIGTLKFGDTSGAQNWTLAASNGLTLKLDTGTASAPLINVVADTATISAPLSGTNGFTKSGTGTLVLAGDNPLTGTVNLDTGSNSANDGIVRVAAPNALANASIISIRNNNTGASTFQLDGSAGSIAVDAVVSASARNSGAVTLQNLAGTNIFSGDIELGVGGSTYTFQSDSGLAVFTGSIVYVGNLTGGRGIYFTGAGDHLVAGSILDARSGSPISPVSLTKSGGGRLTLAGANAYTDGTTLSGGALFVDGSLPAGTLSISSGTTLGGNGVINPGVALPSGATLAPGDSFGTLTVNNNAVLAAGSRTIMSIRPAVVTPDGISPQTNAQLRVTGSLSFGGALTVTNLGGALADGDSFTLFSAAGITGAFSATNLPALDPGLVWSLNPVTGVLAVTTTNNTPPTISSVSNQTVGEDTPVSALSFTVGDAETPAGSLSVGAASSNPNLVPAGNIVFGGSDSNRTVTITAATNQYGSAIITLNVSDGALNASRPFLLTVNPVNDPPTITAIPNQTWNKNVVIGPLAFTVGDAESAVTLLTLSSASSNTNLIPSSGIVIGGSGANRTVTVTPAANQGGTATVTVTVSDGPLASSSSFLVTILAPIAVGKDDNDNNLDLGSSWVGGVAPDANAVAVWDSRVTSANTVAPGADLSWSGLSISNPAGPVTITSGNTITLGQSGINMASASQDLTISSGLTLGEGNQDWNVASGRTLTLNTGVFTRSNSATVNLPGAGTVVASMTGITNDASLPLPGIVGPWLSLGTGANTRYASVGGGNLAAYTGMAVAFNWNTTLPNNTNMEVSATTGAIGVDRMCNTLRWTGGTATQPYGSGSSANRLILNGLMNAGSGPITFSINSGTPRIVIGTNNSNNELVIQAANAGIGINLPIVDATAGASRITVVGPNTVTLAGANTYTGETRINSGTLKLGAANTIPDASSVIVNGTLDMGSYSDTFAGLSGAGVVDNSAAGTPTLTVSGTANSTFSGTIKNTAGTLAIAKTGAGTLTLAAANAYAGTTTIGASQGAAVVRAAANQALGTNTIAFDSTGNGTTARLELTGGINLPNAISLSGRNNSTVAIENISGNNTLSGQVGLIAGGGTYNIQSDAGSLALGTAGSTGISIWVTGTRTVTLQGAGSGRVDGNIVDGAGTLSIVMAGSGTWTLNGANTYSGSTTVNDGTLLVNGSLGSGSVTAVAGTLGGNGVIGGAVSMQAGSTLAPGTSIGQLTVLNDVILSGTTLMEISKFPMNNDQLLVSGTLTYGGTLTVNNLAGTLAAGDSFQLFNAPITSGSFAAINLPPPGDDLAWDTSNLASGVISVVAAVKPQFSAMNQTGDGNFHFTGAGVAGVTYELEAATTLETPIPWVFITNAVADQNGVFELWDISATNFPQRFYRIVSPR